MDLYTENIIDHYENPRNWGKIENSTMSVDEVNPLCGDQLHFDLQFENTKLTDIKFHGQGCAISKASASMLTEIAKGKEKSELEAISRLVQHE